jgi:hypothetical protein
MPTINLVMGVIRTEAMRLSQDKTLLQSAGSVSERRSPRRDSGLNCFNDTESPGSQRLSSRHMFVQPRITF